MKEKMPSKLGPEMQIKKSLTPSGYFFPFGGFAFALLSQQPGIILLFSPSLNLQFFPTTGKPPAPLAPTELPFLWRVLSQGVSLWAQIQEQLFTLGCREGAHRIPQWTPIPSQCITTPTHYPVDSWTFQSSRLLPPSLVASSSFNGKDYHYSISLTPVAKYLRNCSVISCPLTMVFLFSVNLFLFCHSMEGRDK